MIQVRKQIEFRLGTRIKSLSDEKYLDDYFDTKEESIHFVKDKFTDYTFDGKKSVFIKEEDGVYAIDNIRLMGIYRSTIYFVEIEEETIIDGELEK